MKTRVRKKGYARGSVKTIEQRDLGGGRSLTVHELRPPGDPAVRSAMEAASLAMQRGDGNKAAALAREVWQMARGDRLVGVFCGQMLAKYGEREEAARVYCETEGDQPGSWEPYWNLGRFLLAAGMHLRATGYLEEAVRIAPGAVGAHLDLARCHAALGHRAEAQDCLQAARDLDPRARL